MLASQISLANGLYIQLNDDSINPYQVIKAVVYNSSGTVVSQVNSLIPGYYASPADYQFNTDGTARAAILQSLHPLSAQIGSGASAAQYAQTITAFCF